MSLGRSGQNTDTAAAKSSVVANLVDYGARNVTTPVRHLSAQLEARLRRTPSVQQISMLHATPGFGKFATLDLAVECSEIEHAPVLGRSTPGAATALVGDIGLAGGWSSNENRTWGSAPYTPAQVAAMPLAGIVVTTDGSTAAIEHARTILEVAFSRTFVGGFPPETISEGNAQQNETRRSEGYQRLADIVIITSLPIAGCTLAVSVISGVNERRRAFSLLRLTGAPLPTLRRIIGVEAAVPLLISAAASIAIGFLTADLFLRAQLDEGLSPPGLNYYASIIGGLLASLAIIASTFPVVRRITGPEAARND